jgi:hypothetical protein
MERGLDKEEKQKLIWRLVTAIIGIVIVLLLAAYLYVTFIQT